LTWRTTRLRHEKKKRENRKKRKKKTMAVLKEMSLSCLNYSYLLPGPTRTEEEEGEKGGEKKGRR